PALGLGRGGSAGRPGHAGAPAGRRAAPPPRRRPPLAPPAAMEGLARAVPGRGLPPRPRAARLLAARLRPRLPRHRPRRQPRRRGRAARAGRPLLGPAWLLLLTARRPAVAARWGGLGSKGPRRRAPHPARLRRLRL